MMMESAISKTANGRKKAIDRLYWLVPGIKKSGKCHAPQMMPIMMLAYRGFNVDCSRGSAYPRHPISSSRGPPIIMASRNPKGKMIGQYHWSKNGMLPILSPRTACCRSYRQGRHAADFIAKDGI